MTGEIQYCLPTMTKHYLQGTHNHTVVSKANAKTIITSICKPFQPIPYVIKPIVNPTDPRF